MVLDATGWGRDPSPRIYRGGVLEIIGELEEPLRFVGRSIVVPWGSRQGVNDTPSIGVREPGWLTGSVERQSVQASTFCGS